MLALKLLSHTWKQSLRSASRGQQTAGNIIIFLLVLVFALNLLGIGLYLDALLKQLEPGSDPILLCSGWVVYLLGIDLVLRLVLQRIPGQVLVPYLTLRLPRALLVHLLLVRSFASLFNLLPWAVIIPFAVDAAVPVYGTGAAVGWTAALALLVAANSLLNLILKKLSMRTLPVALALGALVAGLFALDYAHLISLTSVSRSFLAAVLETPALASLALLAPVLLYAIAFRILRRRMTLEDLAPASTVRADTASRYRFLESRGPRGRFVALELKLFLRNRRPRASLLMSLMVIPVGVLFYGMLIEDPREAFPVPSSSTLALARQSEPGVAPPGMRLVSFHLDASVVPPGAHPYVTGDHPSLAAWDPDAVPLLRNADSSWSRAFLVEDGTTLRYCFTLGSWQTEEKDVEGTDSPAQTLVVHSDTVISRSAISWKTSGTPLAVQINLVYWGLIVTGIFMFIYGQFFLAFESTFFDALLCLPVRYRWLLATKVSVLFSLGVLAFLVSLPYAFMDIRILYVNAASFVYNIGVNSYVMLYLAARSRKRFELNESVFSQQGKSAAQFVAILPMWILPIIVFALLDAAGVPYALYVFLGGSGILGLLFHKPILRLLYASLENNRHEIAAGFRQGGGL